MGALPNELRGRPQLPPHLRSMPGGTGGRGKVQTAHRVVSKKERYLMRTGTKNRAERRIILLREQRKAPEAVSTAAASAAPPAEPTPPPPVPAVSDKKGRLAEAEARGLGGVDEAQQLRRLARVQTKAEEARQQAAASTLTPAAASLLAQLRSGAAS